MHLGINLTAYERESYTYLKNNKQKELSGYVIVVVGHGWCVVRSCNVTFTKTSCTTLRRWNPFFIIALHDIAIANSDVFILFPKYFYFKYIFFTNKKFEYSHLLLDQPIKKPNC